MPECGADGNEQTAPARLSVRSVSKWRQIDEIAPAAAGASREIAPKVAPRSQRLRLRFAIFADECSKKYLARAGTSEIIAS
jgi:hypothetical protein